MIYNDNYHRSIFSSLPFDEIQIQKSRLQMCLSHSYNLPKHNNNNLWVTVTKARRKRRRRTSVSLVDCKTERQLYLSILPQGHNQHTYCKNNYGRIRETKPHVDYKTDKVETKSFTLFQHLSHFQKSCNEMLNISSYSGPKS